MRRERERQSRPTVLDPEPPPLRSRLRTGDGDDARIPTGLDEVDSARLVALTLFLAAVGLIMV